MGTEGMVTEKLAAAVMGYGTIGSGVVEILEQNKRDHCKTRRKRN